MEHSFIGQSSLSFVYLDFLLLSRSSAEEDVWELTRDSLATAGHPLTLEEAFQLKSTWERQHSTENLVEAMEFDQQPQHRHPRGAYMRLRAGDEDDDDDEGSSTEVEGEEWFVAIPVFLEPSFCDPVDAYDHL